ncbi:hypothetical protein EON64_20365 [archaeon]|nr:MAG: hypothetical protein EON64_20365 [archaeon]
MTSRPEVSKPTDKRAPHQQRTVIMNKEEAVAKSRVYKTAKQLEAKARVQARLVMEATKVARELWQKTTPERLAQDST